MRGAKIFFERVLVICGGADDDASGERESIKWVWRVLANNIQGIMYAEVYWWVSCVCVGKLETRH